MPKIARAAGLVFLGILSGCGGPPSTSNAGPPPPHEGKLTSLPGGKGYVEVVQKPVASPKSPVTGEVSFYFLKEDGISPISPAPSSGTLTVGKKKVTLQVQDDTLTTPKGLPLFPKGGMDGELSVELDGKSVTIPLGIR